ncbi:MAG: hypothetical protein GTO51_05915 [Candidatus Latescibacteria bacterium]|nr:hypothetical protein [Candidatus Latescibacterota bacterium]NIM21327.1 hypothetical protein [Candidatus Latescibacterota bacterium]NIM65508.1 hypothetical protein [Candidatus Latescibacterota bacterium]NIO01888.1 hypothetical protein [Candidatus Latescibacterota bacterium]NIO56326.1 hypothetical protein [Candidatus Latescibacterota bacterium]
MVWIAILIAALSAAGGAGLRDARKDIADLRYREAEEKLTAVARLAEGEERQEALFLLASLKQSATEAELIYQEIINVGARSTWAKKASLEIAKIRYAVGNYDEALRIIKDSFACDVSDEACLFYGLSAMMLERYEEARQPLDRVKRGKLRPWAYLSLAEIEMAVDNREEACRRYRAMANTMINPTALYRHAECLEKNGDMESAKDEFLELVRNFRNTPEAILATEKLQILQKAELPDAPEESVTEPEMGAPPYTEGFTLQFGSFHDRYNAIKLAAKLKRIFPGVRIDSDLVGSREVHRVRLGYFRTREEAQLKAEAISRETGDECVIMNLP